MSKKLFVVGIAAILGFSLATTTTVYAVANYHSMARNATPMHQIVLEPGWKSSCSSDFVIQNLNNKDLAKVEITLGKDGKIKDVIHQWEKRGYELIPILSFAKQLGKTVDIDDIAIIENTSQNSKVSIHC